MEQEQIKIARKMVVGLRQVVGNMLAQSAGRMEDRSVDSKGFLAEAMDQYADRISGYATELATAIGYVEPSADLIAARTLAAAVLERISGRIKLNGVLFLTGKIAAAAVVAGDGDESDVVQDLLTAVAMGRELASQDADRQRMEDMLRPAAQPAPPKRLTITIDGPPGSGKTILGEYLVSLGGMTRKPYSHLRLLPHIIEMRDGRRFDVRNDTFIDQVAA